MHCFKSNVNCDIAYEKEDGAIMELVDMKIHSFENEDILLINQDVKMKIHSSKIIYSKPSGE